MVRKFMLLYFRFYICNGGKFIIDRFQLERTAKENFFFTVFV